jgi:hypothetical protein
MSRIGRTVAIATQLTVSGFSQARAQAADEERCALTLQRDGRRFAWTRMTSSVEEHVCVFRIGATLP